MQLEFACPRCEHTHRTDPADGTLRCDGCGWSRTVPAVDVENGRPARCLACECDDLWRKKDFSPRLGIVLVGLAIVLSTIAWAQMEPLWAIGILMAFALVDLLLYTLMSDVLVCYRCGARHRHANLDDDHPRFNLEMHERYRQESLRLQSASNHRESFPARATP
jgi:hypothetical protein